MQRSTIKLQKVAAEDEGRERLRRVKGPLLDALLSRRRVRRLRGLTLLGNWFLRAGAGPKGAEVMG